MNDESNQSGPVPRNLSQVVWWASYDFANSVVNINMTLYFSQWLVIDNHVSEFWYNLILMLTTVLLLTTTPALGVISDRMGKLVPFLRAATVPAILFTIVIGVGGQLTQDPIARIALALGSFFIVTYAAQASLVFYNALLGHVSSKSEYGRTSGIGFAAGWVGSIVGLFLILPFVEGKVPLVQPGRIQAFVPSALIMTLLVLPSLLLLREPVGRHTTNAKLGLRRAYEQVVVDLKQVRAVPGLWHFLLAYWLFIDANLTLANNAPLYLEIVMKFPDREKALLGALLVFMSAVGALIWGFISDRVGLPRSLTAILLSIVFILVVIATTQSVPLFVLLFGVLGLLHGGVWTVSRALFAALIPRGQGGEYFGIYSAFERFASIVGPAVWTLSVVGLQTLGPGRYRVALLSMALLVLASVFFMRTVRLEPRAP